VTDENLLISPVESGFTVVFCAVRLITRASDMLLQLSPYLNGYINMLWCKKLRPFHQSLINSIFSGLIPLDNGSAEFSSDLT